MKCDLWYNIRFWNFVKEFQNVFKYDPTCKFTVIYHCTSFSRPHYARYSSPRRLVKFLESLSCDMFDDFEVLELFFSGRYSGKTTLISDGEFIKS